MMKKNILLHCGLCVSVVFMSNVIALVHSQRSLVSSTTNTSTLSGETIKFDCSELTILTKTTTFEWSLNGKPLPIEKNRMRMSLEKNDRILMIINVTSNDDGIYKCDIFDKYRNDYSIFNFTVRESPKLEIHKRAAVNDTLNVGERARLNCLNELLQGTLATQIDELTWLKNGKPYSIESGDRVKFDNQRLTIMIKSIVLEDQGIYECTASNKFRIDYAVYNITVVDSQKTKVYNNYIANFTRYYGESVSWCCILNTEFSVDDFSYTWFKNNTRIQPYSSSKFHNFMLELNKITYKDEGSYSCSASNLTNNITGHLKFSLTVLDRPKIVNHRWYTSNITAITGANITLKCELFYSSRTLNNKYQWNTEGIKSYNYYRSDSNDLTNNTFYLNNIVFDNNGTYFCDSSNLYFIFRSNYMLHVVDSPEPEKNGWSYSILLFIILFFMSITLAGFYIISLRREQALKKILEASRLQFENGDIDKWNPDLGIEEQAELLPYDKQWEFPIDKLKIGKQLGSGAFGVVFIADATGIIDKNTISTVAVKMIKPNSESVYTKSLISELKIMIHIGKHLNVVNLLGACTEDINNLMVIVEYCRFGNIREYLLKHRDCFINQITPDGFFDFNIKTTSKNLYYQNIPKISNTTAQREKNSTSVDSEGYLLPDEMEPIWRNNYRGNTQPLNTHDLLCWSFQVARGMEYLASKKILHGDLAIRNILLADDNIVKICDFGFSKTMLNIEVYKKSSSVLLPFKWMAIESIRDQVFSIQSDVWSFGIVLWEIFSLAVNPYPNEQPCNDLFNRLVDGYRMEQPKYANFQLYKIMLDCWNINPQARPSFTYLARYLGNFLKDGSTSYYINLNEVYVKKFTKNTSTTDYINMITSPSS